MIAACNITRFFVANVSARASIAAASIPLIPKMKHAVDDARMFIRGLRSELKLREQQRREQEQLPPALHKGSFVTPRQHRMILFHKVSDNLYCSTETV